MDKKNIVIFFTIMYFKKKIENITLESLCKKDGNCFYSSKNGTFSVKNIDSTNAFISNLTIPSGKIQIVNGEVICKTISC